MQQVFFFMEINEVNGCWWRRINWIRCVCFWSGNSRRATLNTSSPHCNTWLSHFTIILYCERRDTDTDTMEKQAVLWILWSHYQEEMLLLFHCCNISAYFPFAPDVICFRLHGVSTLCLTIKIYFLIMRCLIMNSIIIIISLQRLWNTLHLNNYQLSISSFLATVQLLVPFFRYFILIWSKLVFSCIILRRDQIVWLHCLLAFWKQKRHDMYTIHIGERFSKH